MSTDDSKIQTMYLVIRCEGCYHLITASGSSRHVLCPICGNTTELMNSRVYVQCRDRSTAEDIRQQLTRIISDRKGKDLTEEEIHMLRQRFEAWERQTGWS